MASYDIAAFAAPLSNDEPCGPDLEELGDPEYWQFTGAIETELPTTFDTFFEARASNVEYADRIKACAELLERSRDLRLLVWLAKLCVLNRDLGGFVDSVVVIATLLSEQWESVHPMPFEGDQTMRMVTLERLDERPSIELPLQYVRLIEDQAGPVAFRDHLVAQGEVQPREGERFRSGDDLRKSLARCDIEKIVDARERIDTARTAVNTLRNTWLEKAGYDQAVQLERLPTLLDRIHAYLDAALAARRPDLAGAPEPVDDTPADTPGAGAPEPVALAVKPTIESPRDVVKALAAVNAYFETAEPSSPARLLVRQSQALVGRSWIDVVQTLMPNQFDEAFIAIDGPSPFRLPLSTLSDRLQIGQGYDDPPTYDDDDDDTDIEDGWGSTEDETAEGDDGGESEDGAASDEATDDPGATDARNAAPDDGPPPHASGPKLFVVNQRADAAGLITDVVTYYRRVEPSSPLPVLLERAQTLMTSDFASILREIVEPPSE